VDKADASRLDTAFRELDEELDIKRDQVEFIGSLGHFQTVRSMDVETFVGIWDGREEIRFDTTEIARVLEIPLDALIQTHMDENFVNRTVSTDDLLYPVQGATVWGLTARIFHYLIELFLPYAKV
jgi:hypothetical protein